MRAEYAASSTASQSTSTSVQEPLASVAGTRLGSSGAVPDGVVTTPASGTYATGETVTSRYPSPTTAFPYVLSAMTVAPDELPYTTPDSESTEATDSSSDVHQ